MGLIVGNRKCDPFSLMLGQVALYVLVGVAVYPVSTSQDIECSFAGEGEHPDEVD